MADAQTAASVVDTARLTEDTLVRRLDGRALFFDANPYEASRSNLAKSADLFREAARIIDRQAARIAALEALIRDFVEAQTAGDELRAHEAACHLASALETKDAH